MGNVNASALSALQSRINTERARRGLGNVTFTGGVAAGSTILATHFSELRSATETLNTLGSQTFNWSGTVAAGASITDVLPQIDNFVTTLEGETLASWHTVSVSSTQVYGGELFYHIYSIPSGARGQAGAVRFQHHVSQQGVDQGPYRFGNVTSYLLPDSKIPTLTGAPFNDQIYNYWTLYELACNPTWTGARSFCDPSVNGGGLYNNGTMNTSAPWDEWLQSQVTNDTGALYNTKQDDATATGNANKSPDLVFHGHGKRTHPNQWRYLSHANTNDATNLIFLGRDHIYNSPQHLLTSSWTVEAYY